MFAEYEKAQLMERYRRGKAHRARCGSVNVLGGAPFGYRYVPKTADSGASYEIVDHEAVIAAELFRRYTDDGASIADLTRWLTSENVPTRTGKARWDRSVVWGMLRNPAYAGTAVFGKTQVLQESPGLNRRARLEGRSVPRASKTVGRPREEWIEIPVPAIVTAGTFGRAAQRLADNKRYAARNTKVPSLLQGLAACTACGYGYYRTSTRTTNKKIYYYRCLGSDDYRYEGGRVCGNKPVRADYLDDVVWDHITALLADPALIRAEITRRLDAARTADPATRQRKQLELALAKAATAITAMIQAYSEQLITIDELRTRMPHLRGRETSLRGQIDALDAQLADRDAYLKLADDLEGFLAQLHGNAATATVEERQRVLRLLVKDILIGPEKITIRHRIPTRPDRSGARQRDPGPDTEGDHRAGYLLRWGRDFAFAVEYRIARAGGGRRRPIPDRLSCREVKAGCPALTRYADDLVVCCHSRQQAEQVKARLAEWLEPRGLAFNEAKTRIVPVTEGFDFLGFNLRRYPNGKLLIKPGATAIKRFRDRLAKEFRALRGANVAAVLAKIVPIVRGWVAYYRTVVSTRVFAALTDYLWKLTYKWACWSHPNKPKHWIIGRYFGKFNKFRNDRWVFGDKDTGAYLPKPSWTDIVRHTLVKGGASPDDPALAGYWAQRRQKVKPPLDSYTVRLLSRQDGRCSLCGENLLTRDQPPQSPQGWERWFL